MSKTRASCFITGSKHLETDESLVVSSVSLCLEPVMKHSPSFLTYYFKYIHFIDDDFIFFSFSYCFLLF